MQYAELHCHSSFSLLDGASSPEELVSHAVKLGLTALALTDHNDLGGIVRFAQSAKELDFPAIVGAELTLDDASHLTLLAETVDGYKNLCHLITKARTECQRGKPQITWADLFAHNHGLIALSGCPQGKIPTLIAAGKYEQAKQKANQLKEVFAGSFYLEMWDHQLRQEALIARKLLEISKACTIPPVVTNNVHYARPAKRIIHDVLTCLRHEVKLEDAGRRLRPNGSWYLKSAKQMYKLWQHLPEGIFNTLAIAERCQFRLGSLKPSLPKYDLPDGMSHNQYLGELVWQGAKRRYPNMRAKERKQISHELELIYRLDLAPYFLIMWDIVNFAKTQGISVQGRGSAANSAVCYCLAITAVDPIAMDLLFERFLSEGRNEPPDIDLDIAHQEREKVLQYVYNKYGRAHAAMVSETITYRGRSAVRDAARVLGFSTDTQDKLARQCHHHEAIGAASALVSGGAEQAGLNPKDKLVKRLIQVVAGLNQLPRHRSIHVGGFVLSGEPLGNMVPIENASMPGRTVIQWDKDDLDFVGMIKIDLLGLGMLTLIQEALKLVEEHRGIKIDLAHLDMNDKAIYEMLCQADTIGVFQVESRAQMNILPRLRPQCFYDIIVSIALVRPGPIQGNIVHPYVRRRRGQEPVSYLHPSLEPILKRTLGVPLFQEQGMRLATVAAGFSPARADHLRRVMSHKRSHEKMSELCQELAEGMRANNFSQEAIETITHQLQAFASYGFPESHAASFALLVYASAYLKKYFAPEFYCALLNAQPMGFYSVSTVVRDALVHSVEVHPVDLVQSKWDCTIETAAGQLALRIGLRYIRGLGQKAEDTFKRAWQNGGLFVSLADFCKRTNFGIKTLQLLAQAGAFDSLCQGRRNALWQVLGIVHKKKQPLFESLEDLSDKSRPTNAIEPMSQLEETIADYRTLGLTTGQHPMVYWRAWAEKQNIVSCGQVSKQADGEILTAAGGVICRQRPGTAKGVVFITLEDETGMSNVVVWPNMFEKYRQTILTSSFLAIRGRLQVQEGVANIIANHIEKLPELNKEATIAIASHDFQ
jgi:error-prone DNA polymerase